MRKKEIQPFATAWMDTEGIVLSEVSQRKTSTVWYLCSLESKSKTKKPNKNKQTKS